MEETEVISKRTIEVTDYANEILKAVPKGALLTTKAGDKVNVMTIGWGTLGTTWYRPVFVAYIPIVNTTLKSSYISSFIFFVSA